MTIKEAAAYIWSRSVKYSKKILSTIPRFVVSVNNATINRPVGYIYMFHNVAPYNGALPVIDENRVSPDFFERFLLDKSNELDFIPLCEVPARMSNRTHKMRPFAVVTFDDGYADNYQYAYPILKRLQIPFTIFVSVDFVADHTPIWNYPLIIERIVRSNSVIQLSDGSIYQCASVEQKCRAFQSLKSRLFATPYDQLREQFERLYSTFLSAEIFPQHTLSWNQISEMAADPLCTIGSHTMSHCRLAMDDDKVLRYEITNSRKTLGEKLGRPIRYISYPYGSPDDVSSEAVRISQESGYLMGLVSSGGPVRRFDKDLFHLKRMMVNER